jgi:uncharacterized protein YecE (DUF72 family)
MAAPGLHLGLPMWANPAWRGGFYPPHGGGLAEYARVFSAVEGNTTFYSGAPRPETLAAWAAQAPAGFRFCFKLPARLTHERRLLGVVAEVEAFLAALGPLHDRLGPVMVQLPRDFGVEELSQLDSLLRDWPAGIPCAVEVRHREFFHKGAAERALNRLLISHGVDRVMLDVRPLFGGPDVGHPGLRKAMEEKPKRPLHVLSTAACPLVRFIGHLDLATNERYFEAWVERLSLWIKQGKTPFLFVHTPDNRQAPMLARRLHARLAEAIDLAPLAPFAGENQARLF